jgi:polar amino acid transport system substrate-binding protein
MFRGIVASIVVTFTAFQYYAAGALVEDPPHLATPSFSQDYIIYTEQTLRTHLDSDGVVRGYGIEALNEMLRRANLRGKIVTIAWPRAYYAASHQNNILIFPLVRTKEREGLFQWIGPFKESKVRIYSAEKMEIQNLDTIKNMKTGVVGDTALDNELKTKGFTNLVETLFKYQSIDKLLAGELDFVAIDDESFENYYEKYPERKKIFDAYVVNSYSYYLGASRYVPKTDVRALQDALDSMKKDGAFNMLFH